MLFQSDGDRGGENNTTHDLLEVNIDDMDRLENYVILVMSGHSALLSFHTLDITE